MARNSVTDVAPCRFDILLRSEARIRDRWPKTGGVKPSAWKIRICRHQARIFGNNAMLEHQKCGESLTLDHAMSSSMNHHLSVSDQEQGLMTQDEGCAVCSL